MELGKKNVQCEKVFGRLPYQVLLNPIMLLNRLFFFSSRAAASLAYNCIIRIQNGSFQ